MKLPQFFPLPVVLSLFAVSASAALPTFSSQTIALPPLTLRENATASLHPFEGSAAAAPAPLVIPERRIVNPQRQIASADQFAFNPPAGVDYKLLIKHPDPDVDYKLIVKQVGPQDGK